MGWGPRGQLTVFCLEVGNKNDDPERKVVETEDAYKFAGQMGIQLFETSAKENVNVEEVSPGQSQVPTCMLPSGRTHMLLGGCRWPRLTTSALS